jgi:hypothetical protein
LAALFTGWRAAVMAMIAGRVSRRAARSERRSPRVDWGLLGRCGWGSMVALLLDAIAPWGCAAGGDWRRSCC